MAEGPLALRYQWVCAHLPRLDEAEMRELVTDAWRMGVPRMLHDLPAPTALAWHEVERQGRGALRPLLHPDVRFRERRRGGRRSEQVAAHLAAHPTPRPPAEVEVREG